MGAVWEETRGLGTGLSYRAQERVKRLRTPEDEPAARVWARLDPDEQRERLRAAASRQRTSTPDDAVVLAALQRQIEARERRWTSLQVLAPLVLIVTPVTVDNEPWSPVVSVAVAVLYSVGLSTALLPVSRARRANERTGSEGGYPLPDRPPTFWGFDRPILGDPLLPVAMAVAGVLFVLWWGGPTSAGVVVDLVAGVSGLFVALLGVGVVLGTVRELVRGLRGW